MDVGEQQDVGLLVVEARYGTATGRNVISHPIAHLSGVMIAAWRPLIARR
jgi:hypothetical protein